MSEPTVWCMAKNRLDVSDADRFGRVVRALPPWIDPTDWRAILQVVDEHIIPRSSTNDLFISAGPSLVSTVLAARWFSLHTSMKLLVWSATHQRYAEVEIDASIMVPPGAG